VVPAAVDLPSGISAAELRAFDLADDFADFTDIPELADLPEWDL
jgi:hypothetical protein